MSEKAVLCTLYLYIAFPNKKLLHKMNHIDSKKWSFRLSAIQASLNPAPCLFNFQVIYFYIFSKAKVALEGAFVFYFYFIFTIM